ncbi:RHS repeat protein [Amphritea pacifica]|uniref:RHS repeat protein n=1 Tax=Amphritea pacifica TaxID=2811233 RepID=A0ABS2WDL6_9GAMM|nr:RHS repeat protein [Amphritea pacifica]MBN0989810.1 RHS repeat protein [Amphritea pacifica]
MELSSSYTRLRIAPTLLFFLSCISTAAPLTTEQASQLEQCIGGNASVSSVEGEDGWGEVPEGWIDWYTPQDYHLGKVWFTGMGMNDGSGCMTDYNKYNLKLRAKAFAESKGKKLATNLQNENGPGTTSGGICVNKGVLIFYKKEYYYNLGWGEWYNYSIVLFDEKDVSIKPPKLSYPQDITCKLTTTNGFLKASQYDPDCSEEQKKGYSVNRLISACSFPVQKTKQDGKPSCGIGNPINIATGNKFQSVSIYVAPITLSLSYNSSIDLWEYNFQSKIDHFNISKSLLIRPDGKGLPFTLLNGQWTSDGDIFYQLTDLGSGNSPRWQVITPEANTELYNEAGQLLSITSLSGDTTTLSYSSSTTIVTNHLGDTLVLSYDANGNLSSAQLNNEVNHSFNFDAEGRLLSRTDNEGNTTQYHYEDTRFPKHLTGITGPDGKRFASWAYDDQGRGIMSEHAGQEHVELVFNTDGSTTVTNELGKQTTYHFTEIEGLKRPTLIEGHATANCVGSNKAYTYYPSGLLETKTDWAGNTTRYEYNDRGLITLIAEAEGSPQERITTQVWDSTKPLLLERVQGSQRARFIYNQLNQLKSTILETR